LALDIQTDQGSSCDARENLRAVLDNAHDDLSVLSTPVVSFVLWLLVDRIPERRRALRAGLSRYCSTVSMGSVEIVDEHFGLTLQSLPFLRYGDVCCVRSGALWSRQLPVVVEILAESKLGTHSASSPTKHSYLHSYCSCIYGHAI
jgi:hypothetical protein